VRGTPVRVSVQVEQRRHRRVDNGDHVTTTATVTAVGAAQRLEFLAMH
jgi:ribosome-associated protein YbcJ (S4-like RNA binding protein)